MATKKPAPRMMSLDDLIAKGYRHSSLDAPTEGPAVAEEPPKKSGTLARMGDVGLSVLKGTMAIPESVVGLADLVTGGYAGKAAEAAGFRPGDARQIIDSAMTPEQQAANRAVSEADGFAQTLGAAIANPSTIVNAAAESVPLMLGGGVVGRGLMGIAPRMSGAAAVGAGEGVMAAGSQAEQIRQQTEDGTLSAGQALTAAGSGAMTGVLGAVAGRIANRLGIGDVDQLVAGVQSSAPAVQKGFVRKMLEGAVSEGVLEELPQSIQEQVAQNFALGKPLEDGVDQAAVMGMLSGGLMGGIAGPISGPQQSPADQIRSTKVPESGPLTRAANAGVEAQAQSAENWTTSPGVGQASKAPAAAAQPNAPDWTTELGIQQPAPEGTINFEPTAVIEDPGLSLGDPVEIARKNVEQVAGGYEPISWDGANKLANAAKNAGHDVTVVKHPSGSGFTVVQRRWVTRQMVQEAAQAADSEAKADRAMRDASRLQMDGQPPSQGPAQIGMDTRPTGRMLAGKDGQVRPETRMDQINLNQRVGEAVQRRQAKNEMGLTPDVEHAQADRAASMPSFERDIVAPSGKPFANRKAAEVRAIRAGKGFAVVPVDGGFVVRDTAQEARQIGAEPLKIGMEPLKLSGPQQEQPQTEQGGQRAVGMNPAPLALEGPKAGKKDSAQAAPQGGNGVSKQKPPQVTRFVTKSDMVGSKVEWQEQSANGKWARLTTFDTMQQAKDAAASSGYDAEAIPRFVSEFSASAKRFLQAVPESAPASAPENQARQGAIEAFKAAASAKQKGIDHQRSAEMIADRMIPLVESKSADGLISMNLGSADMNPGSRAMFEALTGVKLPKQRGASERAIDAWAGVTEAQRAEKDAAKRAAIEAKSAERDMQGAKRAAANVQVKDGERVIAGDDWVDELRSKGFTNVVRRGPKTYLANADGAGFLMMDRWLADYARKAAAADSATAAPPPKTKATPAKAQVAAAAPQDNQPFTHAGLNIRPSRVKFGDEVKDKWVVQSPENAEREARGERQIGGDRIAETREQAIKTAEQETNRYATEKASRAEIEASDKARISAAEAKKEANRSKTILERRADAVLDKPSKLPASAGLGLGTKREAMDKAIEQNRQIVEVMVSDTAARKRDQEAVDAVRQAGYILGVSNENIPVVKKGLEARARLKEGKYQMPEYRVYQGSDQNGAFFEITKTEYDYAQKVKAAQAAESKPDQETAPATDKPAEPPQAEQPTEKKSPAPVARAKAEREKKLAEPFIKVAADSVAKLRKSDVDRVLERAGEKNRQMVSDHIKANRPDLAQEVDEVMAEQTAATHSDPGQAPEPVTPAVVRESMSKAADNEDRKPSAMKAELLGMVDAKLKEAPDYVDFLETVKTMGEKDAIAVWTNSTGAKMGERYAPADYSRKTVFFDVKGDGKFTVNNTVRSLLTFRKAVESSGGFKDRQNKPAVDRVNSNTGRSRENIGARYGVETGSGSQKAAFDNMVNEGDLEAASDYADAVGLDMDPQKIANATKVLRWREDRDAKAEVQAINEAWGDEQNAASASDLEAGQKRRAAAEAVRKATVQRTNANSAMVWQIIGPDGEPMSGPPGKYPGRVGLLAGSATMGDRGWKTKREADAALNELNRKADEILGGAPSPAAPRVPVGQHEAAEVFAIYRAAESVARGLWSSGVASKHNTKLRQGLSELGLKQAQVDRVMAEAATVHAQRTRGSTTMTFLSGQDFMAGARRAGVVPDQIPVPAVAAPASAAPKVTPDAPALTPKLFHDARLQAMADDSGADLDEVRQNYETDAGRAESDRLWSAAVEREAKAGRELQRLVADRFFELNPTATLPDGAVPAGYQRPDARKREADAAEAKRQDRREAKAEREAAPTVGAGAFSAMRGHVADGQRVRFSDGRTLTVRPGSPSGWSLESDGGKVESGPHQSAAALEAAIVALDDAPVAPEVRSQIAEFAGKQASKVEPEASEAEKPSEQDAARMLSDGEVRTEDGKVFKPSENKLVGSVPSVRSVEVSKSAKVGEYPVFVEQSGSYRLFTYSKKIAEIGGQEKAGANQDAPVPTDRLDQEAQLWAKLTDGAATVDEFKAGFEAWVRDKDAIIERFSKLTKAQLLSMGGGYFAYQHKSDTKDKIVASLWSDGMGKYSLGKTISYVLGASRNGYQDAVAKLVDATTQEVLADYAKAHKQALEEAGARVAQVAKAMEDPKTLEDFHVFLRAQIREGKTFKDARLGMTPEQRAKYDELSAESTREKRDARKRALKTELKTSTEAVGGQVIETKHTQKGHDLFVVQLEKRIDREDYERVNASAKKLGGFYSSFRGRGAVPGFQFRDRASADAFLKLVAGDTGDAKAIADQRRDAFEDDRSQSAAERLKEMADKLDADADASMALERKQNTARRARFAASAERAAGRQKAMATTMRNLAAAISDGRAKFLDTVRQKVQVEYLEQAVATAKDAELRAKFQSYAERERHAGEPATIETADFAEFPSYSAMRSDLASLGRQLLEVDGTKKLGQRLMSVADDVTDAFKAWASEGANMAKLKVFVNKGTGDAAAFPTEKAAELAITRSGYRGRAIPWQVKRGQWTIVSSPSEAMERGVWDGDGDKRITLSAEFGAELVQQIGKAARRGGRVSVPWQFEAAFDRLNRLSRMGIETPAEFRSALREFIGLRSQAEAPSKVRELERAMVGRKNDGLDFFPTPAETVDAMIDAAEIEPGMRVLEPSAGWGHIAERLASVGASPEVVELSPDRRELLQAKGFNVVGDDFLAFDDANQANRGFGYGDLMEAPDGTRGLMATGGGMGSDRVSLVSDGGERKHLGYFNFSDLVGVERRGVGSGYDRILMNPPFSDRRDAAHVQHAYSLLKPGGRLVAIMGEGVFFGQDKKAQAFRDWLDSVGGTSEKLAEGTFNDPSLPVNTSVNARMVVIEKPAPAVDRVGPGGSAVFSRAPYTPGITSQAGAKPMDAKELERLIVPVVSGWKNGPKGGVKVVQSVNDLPGRLRDDVRSADRSNQAMGFFQPTEEAVYLIADRLGTPERAQFVLFHEVYGHYGLRSILGDEYASTMVNMTRANPKLELMADYWLARYGQIEVANRIARGMTEAEAQRSVNLLATEEALADWAGTNPKVNRLQFIAARIQRGLRKIGLGKVADWLEARTDAEVLDLLANARSAVRDGKGGNARAVGDESVFQRVWHGTPHRGIEKFSTDKIGTGEGAQAYGWGLYFASKREIAEHYRKVLSEQRFDGPDGDESARGVAAWLVANGMPEGLADVVYSSLVDISLNGVDYKSIPEMATAWERAGKGRVADYLRKAADAGFSARPAGQLYAVEIPEDSEMLLWDKPLSEQPDAAKLREIAAEERMPVHFSKRALHENRTGQDFYKALSQVLGSDSSASRVLNSYGIKGIKYLDGTSRDGSGDGYNYVIFSGDDVTGITPMFSRANTLDALKGLDRAAIRQGLSDAFGSAGAKVTWWDKTLGTQYNKAERFPTTFGRVFEAVQRFYEDTSRLANEAADNAPSILPKLESLGDVFKGGLFRHGLSDSDSKAIAGPIFKGTLEDEKVYSDAELKDRFGLDERQRGLYREFRAAVDKGLDQTVAADVVRHLGTRADSVRHLVVNDRPMLRKTVTDMVEGEAKAALQALKDVSKQLSELGDKKKGEDEETSDRRAALKAQLKAAQATYDGAESLRKAIVGKYERGDDLKRKGYAPLMRFGKFAVNVSSNDNGESLFFGLYETRAEANRAARELAEEFKGEGRVSQGVMSAEQHKLFAGVPVESMELFANALGADQSEVFQEWLKLTKNNRSALKRLIHRKGTAGFSQDPTRVLASFVTSSARFTSGVVSMDGAQEVVRQIRDGDVKDEAIKLLDVVSNPAEVSPVGRGLMFFNFLGGSVASALVNMTQPATMTAPYLSQWGGLAVAGKRLASAAKMVLGGKIADDELAKALKRAENEGVVSPQEIHHLQAEASGRGNIPGASALNPFMRKMAFIWGGFFGAAEQFNRRVSFIAAYQTAQAEGMADPFGFAEKAVIETQGLYNKGNVPNWARTPMGALALTFKQFSIHYMEWLVRMAKSGPAGKRAALLALALLAAAGGAEGLPFADDVADLIDTLAQAMGYDFSTKRVKHEFIAKTLGLGDGAADVFDRGLSAVPGVPLDVSARMGMGNLIPATGMLLRSNTDRSRELFEVAGAAGGLAKQYMGAAEKALQGKVLGADGALAAAMPVAIQNLIKGWNMLSTGQYTDTKGRTVMETDAMDAAMKAVGFQPQAIAAESRKIGEVQRSIALAKNVEGEFVTRLAQANIDGKPEDAAAARQDLRKWNEDNPGARIVITQAQVAKRAREMRMTREQRFLKSAPKEMRPAVKEAIQ